MQSPEATIHTFGIQKLLELDLKRTPSKKSKVNKKMYSGDLNTYHFNTKLFEIRISNGSVFKWLVYGLFLCTSLTIQITRSVH